MSEEVKITVRQESEGTALKDAKRDAEELQQAEERLAGAQKAKSTATTPASRASAEADEAKAQADVERARQSSKTEPSKREGRAQLLSDPQEFLARDREAKAAADQEAKAAAPDKSKRDALREEARLTKEIIAGSKLEEAALRKEGRHDEANVVGREIKELEVAHTLQTKLNVGGEEALEMARAKITEQERLNKLKEGERETTAQVRQETRLAQQQEGAQVRLGGQIAGLAGTAALAGAGLALTNFSERRGIGLRDQAQRAIFERQTQRQSGAFGTSGEALGNERALEDQIFAREQGRADLERKAKFTPLLAALAGAGGGAATGAAIGSIVPGIGTAIGAGVGAVVGGAGAALGGKLHGDRSLHEDEVALQREQDALEKQREERKRKFWQEEGGIEFRMAEARAKRSFDGAKEVRQNELLLQFRQEYRRAVAAGAEPETAEKMAQMGVEESVRQRQQSAAAGMVNARTGAAGTAAAARWAMRADPTLAELGPKLDAAVGELRGMRTDNTTEDWRNR